MGFTETMRRNRHARARVLRNRQRSVPAALQAVWTVRSAFGAQRNRYSERDPNRERHDRSHASNGRSAVPSRFRLLGCFISTWVTGGYRGVHGRARSVKRASAIVA